MTGCGRWRTWGGAGVSVSDHIFFTSGGRPRTAGVGNGCDPLTTLAAVAGLSDRLAVQTVVMNSAWVHPGLLLRSFAQLAMLLGGDRVTAGLGAGWSAEEFDALGLAMPKFRTRIDRLAEVLGGRARPCGPTAAVSHDGHHVVTRDLPLSPPYRTTRPDCWWAAGRSRILGLAGRFADLLDLHGDPKHGRVAGTTMAQAAAGDVGTAGAHHRRGSRRPHRADARRRGGGGPAAGRRRAWRRRSGTSPFGSPAQVPRSGRGALRAWAGIPYRPLDRSPYLLFGSPAQMAEALAGAA